MACKSTVEGKRHYTNRGDIILAVEVDEGEAEREGEKAMALVVLVVNEGEDVGCCCRGCIAWWWSKVMVMAGGEVLVVLCSLRSDARYASFFLLSSFVIWGVQAFEGDGY